MVAKHQPSRKKTPKTSVKNTTSNKKEVQLRSLRERFERAVAFATKLFDDQHTHESTKHGTCGGCGCEKEFHTETTQKCTICLRYRNLKENSGKVRRTGKAPGLTFTKPEFAEWFIKQKRNCIYCGIPERLIKELDVKTSIGLQNQTLGIDRLDGDKGYELDNISLCCYACNKARSNTFSVEEMRSIGKGIAIAWTERLAAANIKAD